MQTKRNFGGPYMQWEHVPPVFSLAAPLGYCLSYSIFNLLSHRSSTQVSHLFCCRTGLRAFENSPERFVENEEGISWEMSIKTFSLKTDALKLIDVRSQPTKMAKYSNIRWRVKHFTKCFELRACLRKQKDLGKRISANNFNYGKNTHAV